MSAHDGSRITGPNFAPVVDSPSFAAAVDAPNFAAAVDGPSLPHTLYRPSVRTTDEPTEANIDSYLRRSFKPVVNVT
jgi:hypothetical protein